MKTKKHKEITDNLKKAKQEHLENLADKLLKNDDKQKALNKIKIKGNFLNNF